MRLDKLNDLGNCNSRRYHDHDVDMVNLNTEFYYLDIGIKFRDMRKRLSRIFLDTFYKDFLRYLGIQTR